MRSRRIACFLLGSLSLSPGIAFAQQGASLVPGTCLSIITMPDSAFSRRQLIPLRAGDPIVVESTRIAESPDTTIIQLLDEPAKIGDTLPWLLAKVLRAFGQDNKYNSPRAAWRQTADSVGLVAYDYGYWEERWLFRNASPLGLGVATGWTHSGYRSWGHASASRLACP